MRFRRLSFETLFWVAHVVFLIQTVTLVVSARAGFPAIGWIAWIAVYLVSIRVLIRAYQMRHALRILRRAFGDEID